MFNKKRITLSDINTLCCNKPIVKGNNILPVFIVTGKYLNNTTIYKVIDLSTGIGHDVLEDELINNTEVYNGSL
ncbi:MAG TPA: hypothetical protein VI911_07685 [Patescibacteria group bacterium]|nr:hypothetical protein [Patescibacteria group bacterium]